jgi:hypothetical protein
MLREDQLVLNRLNILRAVILTLTLLVALCSGCQKKDAVAPPIDAKADSVWRHNMVVFEGALSKNQEGDDFDAACGFFWRLTGNLNYSTVGILPTTETPVDVEHLKLWYKVNKARLYWDETAGTVRVHPVMSIPSK